MQEVRHQTKEYERQIEITKETEKFKILNIKFKSIDNQWFKILEMTLYFLIVTK